MQKHSKKQDAPFSRPFGATENDAQKLHALWRLPMIVVRNTAHEVLFAQMPTGFGILFERWHPHEQKEQPQHPPVSVSRRRPAQTEAQKNRAEGRKIPPFLHPRCVASARTPGYIAMACRSEPYAPAVLVSTEGLP
ncbi:MAG: hypothetical protein MR033_07870, partial [Clostridiales bacterium]|nr:hypothetical protein [Clostridiales bacterium]